MPVSCNGAFLVFSMLLAQPFFVPDWKGASPPSAPGSVDPARGRRADIEYTSMARVTGRHVRAAFPSASWTALSSTIT
jgi:hypothetical protein